MSSPNTTINQQPTVDTENQVKCTDNINFKPYTFTEKAYDLCCIGCDKPGIGSSSHNPSNNSCEDNALCCLPLTIVADILCYVPMCLGYVKVKK